MRRTLIGLGMALFACADAPSDDGAGDGPAETGAFAEPYDLEVPVGGGKADGVPARFDPEFVVSDTLFEDAGSLDAATLQAFFEESPYGRRSWLADETIRGRSAAEALVEVAKSREISPLMLLARMQVESGMVSASERPSQRRVDWAFGCGCPDGGGCYDRFRGLDRQVDCAAETLRTLFDASKSGEGKWQAGKAGRTLDPRSVTPANHATAALYGYTPWVLPRRGGNWLVWNVTAKYAKHFEDIGVLAPNGCISGGPDRPFVGAPCECDGDCDFWSGSKEGRCHAAGFCTLTCAGPCPDLSGYASTFCVADPFEAQPQGICVSQAVPENGHCADLPGTLDREVDRYVGDSGASEKTATVCLPVR